MWHQSKTIYRISSMTYFIDIYINMTYILHWQPVSKNIECKIWTWQSQMGMPLGIYVNLATSFQVWLAREIFIHLPVGNLLFLFHTT